MNQLGTDVRIGQGRQSPLKIIYEDKLEKILSIRLVKCLAVPPLFVKSMRRFVIPAVLNALNALTVSVSNCTKSPPKEPTNIYESSMGFN